MEEATNNLVIVIADWVRWLSILAAILFTVNMVVVATSLIRDNISRKDGIMLFLNYHSF
jgi:uncharacterized protein involved in cysteine biosynthesis